jgi:hypothetical protein
MELALYLLNLKCQNGRTTRVFLKAYESSCESNLCGSTIFAQRRGPEEVNKLLHEYSRMSVRKKTNIFGVNWDGNIEMRLIKMKNNRFGKATEHR